MGNKRYRVDLTENERNELTQITTNGKSAAKKITHAHILLLSDESSKHAHTDEYISESLRISTETIRLTLKKTNFSLGD